MTDRPKHSLRRWGHAVLAAALLLFAGAAVLLWSWNGFAAEILAAPALRFRHALALELLLLTAAAMPALAVRLTGARRHGPANR